MRGDAQVVAIDLQGIGLFRGVRVEKLERRWSTAVPKGHYEVATVRYRDREADVVRDFHNRDGSWMTDRTPEDQWRHGVTKRDAPLVAEVLQELVNHKVMKPRLEAACRPSAPRRRLAPAT
jgi:hypothetical protein